MQQRGLTKNIKYASFTKSGCGRKMLPYEPTIVVCDFWHSESSASTNTCGTAKLKFGFERWVSGLFFMDCRTITTKKKCCIRQSMWIILEKTVVKTYLAVHPEWRVS